MIIVSATTSATLRLGLRALHRLRPTHLRLWPIVLRLRPAHLRLGPVVLWLWPVHLRLRPIVLRLGPTHLRLRPVVLRLRPVHLRLRPAYLWLRPVVLRLRSAHLRLRPAHLRLRMILRSRTVHRRLSPILLRSRSVIRGYGRARVIYGGPRYCHAHRSSVVDRSELVAITHSRLLMLLLLRRPLDMLVTHSRLFPGIRVIVYTTGAAIIADLVDGYVIDHRSVDISIVYDSRIDHGHCRIVPEMSAIPFTAIVTTTAISTSIIDTAIVAHMRSPVADMPRIYSADKAPVSRRP